MEPLEAYHGRTGAQHQQAFNRLSAAGFRMIHLSAHGGSSSPRYNAVWVHRPGPGWVAFHGVAVGSYQARFNEATSSGMVPVLVAATGAGSDAVMAAVFEAGVPGTTRARHGLTKADFEAEDADARQAGLALHSVAIYGTSAQPRYVAVWRTPPAPVLTHLRAHASAADYQAIFDSETSLPFFRPRVLSVAEDGALVSMFSNDVVGRTVAYHGLTGSAYQAAFNRHVAEGLMPICVDAGGSGTGARFAAIFAERDTPLPRQWSATGTGPGLYAGVEAHVEQFMRANSVRSAQLTILRSGRLAVQRAYTWSEPGTRRTRVNDRMLLASCSKIFLTAAIQWLYDHTKIVNHRPLRRRPLLSSTQRVYPLLGFSGPADARSDQITVGQLVAHTGGYPQPTDATYRMRQIALDLLLTVAPTTQQLVRRVYSAETLKNAPGMTPEYSNLGYVAASLVVEKVSGLSYLDFVRQRLLAPLGVTEVDPCPTAGPRNWPGNLVMPEDDGLGLTTLNPSLNTQVPSVFGGDQMAKEAALGSCAFASSATALARVIRRHNALGLGGRAVGTRYGSTPGARSAAVSRADDLDWVLIINTRVGIDDARWDSLVKRIDRALDVAPIGPRRFAGTTIARPRTTKKAAVAATS
jgi:CubicO group peptidase (beta-lactamase class C family)